MFPIAQIIAAGTMVVIVSAPLAPPCDTSALENYAKLPEPVELPSDEDRVLVAVDTYPEKVVRGITVPMFNTPADFEYG